MKRKPQDIILRALTWLFAAFTFFILLYLVGYILVRGIPYLKPSLFALKYNSDNVSLVPALITTVMTVLLSLVVAVPLGVFSAIYLVEYASRGSRLVKAVRTMAETLSGIPSIVYGLFGSLFFVVYLGWGMSMLAGALTLSIMVLPLIMRTTEESLKSVPDAYREGSFGLGAGRLRTVFRIVLPAASQGILAGIILSIGRIVGETAALIYTAGTVAKIPANPLESGRTLAIHMYALSSEGLHTGQAYATAVVLLVVVIGINTLSGWLVKRMVKK
jgi:phosphate transport system permease protein